MDRGAWWATVHRVTELDMTEVTAHVCTEQTFSEVSLCSTASSLLPPRALRLILPLRALNVGVALGSYSHPHN